jgi:thymidylate synthase
MNNTNADLIYKRLLNQIKVHGDIITTRNAETWSHINLPNVTFDRFPLVTTRKTAWHKAIREMEWFLSGKTECPEVLLDWWKEQLDSDNDLLGGYSEQFRSATMCDHNGQLKEFDQVKFILNGLKDSPYSRRLLISMWNPGEMATITEINVNPNTPTCCHSIVVQFFVRGNKLHMKTYQRSADMLLGVPHNWAQSWAMLLYFAYHSGYEIGTMTWMWGDAHIYNEESHVETAKQIIFNQPEEHNVELRYAPKDLEYDEVGVPVFRAKDFYIEGIVPEPKVTTKPKLL